MEVPCLTDGLTGGPALNSPDREIFNYPNRHQKVVVENWTWFFDTRGTKRVRQEDSMLYLDYPRENGVFTREFDLRLIEKPNIGNDLSLYVQYAIYDGKRGFCPFSRVNTLPSLYLSLKVQLFAAVLGNEVIDRYPEIYNSHSIFGNTWTLNEYNDCWVMRADLESYNKARGLSNSNIGEPKINGVLGLAISKVLARLIREQKLPIDNCFWFDKYSDYWENLQKAYQKTRKKEAFFWGSIIGLEQNVQQYSPLAFKFIHDNTITCKYENVTILAKEVWELANELKDKNLRAKISRSNNCLDKSYEARKETASKFIRSAKERLRKSFGKEIRSSFDPSQWLVEHSEKMVEMILEYQEKNPGKLFHIDHIIPLAVIPQQLVIDPNSLAWHPCNLQIISDVDNVNKGSLYRGKKYNKVNISSEIQALAVNDLQELFKRYTN